MYVTVSRHVIVYVSVKRLENGCISVDKYTTDFIHHDGTLCSLVHQIPGVFFLCSLADTFGVLVGYIHHVGCYWFLHVVIVAGRILLCIL